ncbi:hypothetical protein HK103_001576 [Boothiomyces macroporosus]|uniref:Uncharacterized protein n=1 Tax=Boothiomyces macroporosus TaxID=261099 RepID=A0AAD5UAE6_9FUNG|nr:hypothetical protein HK103_001576 [Boothiomyces macroporosus]
MSVDFVKDLEISLNNAAVLLERTKQRTKIVGDGRDKPSKRDKENIPPKEYDRIESTNINQLLEITRITESLHKLQSRIIKQHSLLLKEQSQSLQYQNIIQLDNINELQKRQTMHQMSSYQQMIKLNNSLTTIPIQRPVVVEHRSKPMVQNTTLIPEDIYSVSAKQDIEQTPKVKPIESTEKGIQADQPDNLEKKELEEIKDKVELLISLVQKENEKKLDSFDYNIIKDVIHSEQINIELKKIDELIENIPKKKKDTKIPKWSSVKKETNIKKMEQRVGVSPTKTASASVRARAPIIKEPISKLPSPKKPVLTQIPLAQPMDSNPILLSKDPIFLRKTTIRPKSLEFLKSNAAAKKPEVIETRNIATSPIEFKEIKTTPGPETKPSTVSEPLVSIPSKATKEEATSTLPEPKPPSKTESTQISPLFHQTKSVQFQSPTKDASIQHDYSPPPIFELRKPVTEERIEPIMEPIRIPVIEKSLEDRLAEWIKSEVLLKVIKQTDNVPLVTVKPPVESENITKEPAVDDKEIQTVTEERQIGLEKLKETGKVVEKEILPEPSPLVTESDVEPIQMEQPAIKSPEHNLETKVGDVEDYLNESFNTVSTPFTQKSYELSEFEPIVNEDEPSHLMDNTFDEYSLDIISSVIKEMNQVRVVEPPKEIAIQTSDTGTSESVSLSSAYPLPEPPLQIPDSILIHALDEILEQEINIHLLEAIIEVREERYKESAEQLKTAKLQPVPSPEQIQFHGFQEAQQLSERISRLEESLIELEKSKSIIDPSISFIIESLNQSDSSDSSKTPSVSQIISDNSTSMSFTMTSLPTFSEGEIITGLYSQGQIIPRKQEVKIERDGETESSEKTSSGQVSEGLLKDSIKIVDEIERARRIPLPVSPEDETESSI